GDRAGDKLGVLTADGHLSIYIEETVGNLRVNTVVSHTADVTLAARAGSILDFNSATETDRDGRTVDSPNVKAINIDLGAHGGTIGTADNDLDIDSGLSDAGHVVGRLYAEATSSIYITESNYELRVLAAKSETGDVRLTVPDTSLTPTITRGTTFSADPSF